MVVARKGAINYSAVRCDDWRRRRLIDHATSRPLISGRIDSEICAETAAVGLGCAGISDGDQYAATVIQAIAKRGCPLHREVLVERDYVGIPAGKRIVGDSDGIDCAI